MGREGVAFQGICHLNNQCLEFSTEEQEQGDRDPGRPAGEWQKGREGSKDKCLPQCRQAESPMPAQEEHTGPNLLSGSL